MAIAHRNTTAVTTANSGNVTPAALPTGHTTDDILLLFAFQHDNVASTVSGYTLLGSQVNGSTFTIRVFAKRDGGSESAPTLTHASGGATYVFMSAYSGVPNTLTIGTGPGSILRDFQSQTGSQGSGSTTFTVTAPTISGVVANDMMMYLGGEDGSDTSSIASTNWTPPASFTERIDSGFVPAASHGTCELADLLAGSASSRNATANATGFAGTKVWIGIQFALASDAGTVASFPIFRPMLLTLQNTPVQPALRNPPPSSSVAAQLFQQALTATATTTASFVNQVGKLLSATATTTASIVKQVGKPLSATATSTATIVKQVNKFLSATATTTATLAAIKVILKTLSATVTTTATIVKQVNKLLSATATTTAVIVKQVNKLLSATATSTATMSAIKVILRTLTATATTTASMVRQVGSHLSATATTAATITRRIGKALTGTATSTATLAAIKVILKTLTATVTTTASLVAQFLRALTGFFEGTPDSTDTEASRTVLLFDGSDVSSDAEGRPGDPGYAGGFNDGTFDTGTFDGGSTSRMEGDDSSIGN